MELFVSRNVKCKGCCNASLTLKFEKGKGLRASSPSEIKMSLFPAGVTVEGELSTV